MSLDGVIVAETDLSMVDGQKGRLVVKGRDLEHLAGSLSFAEMGELLGLKDLERVGEARARVFSSVRETCQGAGHLLPIEVLRCCVDRLEDPQPIDLVAALGVGLATLARTRLELPVLSPDPQSPHVADLLRLRFGEAAEASVRAAETYLVTVAEHGMNASTFTARVVASTQAGARAAISAALGALQGPLHGGAPGPVLDMLDQLQEQADRRGWLRQKIESGERLMGFGHRIYKVRDPRAEILARACQEFPRATERFQLAAQVEQLAKSALAELKPGRSLDTNVEYYTALLLDGLGFDRSEFTAFFACGRVLGWLAHVEEQQRNGRLIRPESRYVGAIP